MKQVIRRGLKEIIVDEVPDPNAASNHVLVRPFYSLISSGTETADIHKDGIVKEVAENPSHLKTVYNVMMQTNPVATFREVKAKFSDYAVLGYSGAGIIVEKHPSVSDLSVGQRVSYGGEGTGHGEILSIGRNLTARIPDEVPFQHACFTTLGAIAMNAVRRAEIEVGDSVAVIGLGLVGQLISQLVRCHGGIVIATDLQASRVELAKQGGANYTIRGGGNLAAEIQELTEGRGADAVIVAAASKSASPVRDAIKVCRDRGRLVIVGAVSLELPHGEMYIKDLKLSMARAYGPGSYDPNYEELGHDYPLPYVRWTENRNMEHFLKLLEMGQVNVAPLISHEFSLEDAPKAYDTIMDAGTDSLAVLLRYAANGYGYAAADFKPQRTVAINPPSERIDRAELRFAVVGAGNLVRWEHLPALQNIPNTKLQAVYSARGAKGKGYGIRFKAEYATSDYQAILDDDEVDIVLIASRHREHAAQAIAALKSGKHVFVEKPMAITSDECRDIIKTVRESGKQLTVGFNRRFAPFYVQMQRISSKRTGPAVINIRMSAPYMKSGFWAAGNDEGGAIIGEAVHMVDLMRHILGSEIKSVSAYSLPTGKGNPIGENNIAACFKFADGSIANLTYCTIGSDSSAGELVEVFAPGIALASEDFKSFITKDSGRRKKQSFIWAKKGFDAQLASFVKCLREGLEPEVTAEDGAKAFLGSSLMLESAREGGTAKDFNFGDILPSDG